MDGYELANELHRIQHELAELVGQLGSTGNWHIRKLQHAYDWLMSMCPFQPGDIVTVTTPPNIQHANIGWRHAVEDCVKHGATVISIDVGGMGGTNACYSATIRSNSPTSTPVITLNIKWLAH